MTAFRDKQRPAGSLLALLVLVACAFPTASATAAEEDAAQCTRVAAPTGADSAPGSVAEPYLTLERLVESLGPNEVGCLRAGTYGGDSVYLEAPDAELRSFPGETATVAAFMEVKPSAVGAWVHDLRFDASQHSNNTGVKLQADGTRFTDNELTKGGKGICLLAGSYHPAVGIAIERNLIHHCGPASSKLMHQIYLQNTRGAVVRWNVLVDNPGGWGVHLYANADDSLIAHNVIDGNRGGVIFAGADGDTSDGNVARNNAITFSQARWNVEGSWSGEPPGAGNRAFRNCVYSSGADAPSGIENGDGGFSAGSNLVAPGSPYVDRARGDYRLADRACARLVGDVAGVLTGEVPASASHVRPRSKRQPRRRGPALADARAVS